MKITTFVPNQGSNCMRIGAIYGNNQMLDLSAAYSLYLQDRESELRSAELAAALLPSDMVAFCDGLPQTLSRAEMAISHVKGLTKKKDQVKRGPVLNEGYYLQSTHSAAPGYGNRIL